MSEWETYHSRDWEWFSKQTDNGFPLDYTTNECCSVHFPTCHTTLLSLSLRRHTDSISKNSLINQLPPLFLLGKTFNVVPLFSEDVQHNRCVAHNVQHDVGKHAKHHLGSIEGIEWETSKFHFGLGKRSILHFDTQQTSGGYCGCHIMLYLQTIDEPRASLLWI